jgi:hypothetical protein
MHGITFLVMSERQWTSTIDNEAEKGEYPKPLDQFYKLRRLGLSYARREMEAHQGKKHSSVV